MKAETDFAKACRMLKEQQLTCALVLDNIVYISRERGVKPLLDCYYEKRLPTGFTAADKVVGKAAAFLYVLLGAKEVYADVLSNPALAVFQMYGIEASYGQLADAIKNRAGTGFCPMETAVLSVTDPAEALEKIEKKWIVLQKASSQKEK